MFEMKRFAPILAVFTLGAALSACDDAPREQQSEVPAQMEQVPSLQDPAPAQDPALDPAQDPAVPKE
jgi:hypothetical protein